MLIKATRITTLTDARYFAAMEVDFLGFNLEEGTDGYLDPMYMKAIREWVQGPKIIGEFSKATGSFIREAASFFGLDGVMVSAAHHLAALSGLDGLEVQLLLDLPFKPETWTAAFEAGHEKVAAFIVPLDAGTLHEAAAFLKTACARYPVIIQPDMPVADIPALLEALHPAGLSLAGGAEEKVGIKSFDDLEILFESLERS
jgi:phosphoribosylanthranilate isomerase